MHEKFIFSHDWAKMSEQEIKKAEEEGKIRFPSPDEFRKMKKREFNEWRVRFRPYIEEIHDTVSKTVKSFPKGLLFITRYFAETIVKGLDLKSKQAKQGRQSNFTTPF
jgi:hypothetical protein